MAAKPIANQTAANQRVVIALGDPAGIGMEVTLKALASPALPNNLQPLLVGCRSSLQLTYRRLLSQGISSLANPETIEIIDLPLQEPLQPGQPSAATGAASFEWLTTATQLILDSAARALVTAPIAKHAWHAAGHHYPGQTERLAELARVDQASMLFTALSPHSGWRLNTLLATTHIPLSKVCEVLTPERIRSKMDVLNTFCRRFTPHPHLAVAGLNPHAGEQGRIGREEVEWLTPLLDDWRRANPAVQLDGPLPPDTCWLTAMHAWQGSTAVQAPNGILALYHDQGLIPVKLLAFDAAVNTSLGLPFLRTSPDHGTGFDIAPQGCARASSMKAAIRAAWELTAEP